MDNELTYAEHVEAKKVEMMSEYDCEIKSLLRNIELTHSDVNEDGLLSDNFFNRNDVTKPKLKILKRLTDNIKNKINRLYR